jgi:transglutaminase-like putative cysteine protease
MLLSIRHTTELEYSERISESVMELRVAPKSDENQTLRGFGLAVGPAAPLIEHVDWLGNRVHQFSVIEFHKKVVIVAHSAIETHPRQTALGALADAWPLPALDHRIGDFTRFGGPVDPDPRVAELAAELGFGECRLASSAIERVMLGLRERFRYVKGVTKSSTRVSELFEARAGVCQDFAHLALAVLRSAGAAARYVSGYVHRPGAPGTLESHAWCELFLPSVGWVGFDPTHGSTVDERYIAVAVGRSYADVPPNRGVFRGDASESIKVGVEIEEIGEVPPGLLVPRPAPIDVPTFSEGQRPHSEQIDYQAEQQQQ